MKRFITILLIITLCVGLCTFSNACQRIINNNDDNKNERPEKPTLDSLDLSEYIKLGQYKGLTVEMPTEDSRGDTIWEIVLENSEVLAYPEGLAEYYEEQEKALYRSMSNSNMSYEEVLATLNTSEEEIVENSKKRAKEDLVLAAIGAAEGITLTEENINELFDDYVAKYAEFGYTEHYVRERLYDEVISTMLHDKTIEFLIINNKFE